MSSEKVLTKGMLCRNPIPIEGRDWIFFYPGLKREGIVLSSVQFWNPVKGYPEQWRAFTCVKDFRERGSKTAKLPRKGRCVEVEL